MAFFLLFSPSFSFFFPSPKLAYTAYVRGPSYLGHWRRRRVCNNWHTLYANEMRGRRRDERPTAIPASRAPLPLRLPQFLVFYIFCVVEAMRGTYITRSAKKTFLKIRFDYIYMYVYLSLSLKSNYRIISSFDKREMLRRESSYGKYQTLFL